MIQTRTCPKNQTYFDIEILKKANRPIDKLYNLVIYHNPNLPKYYQINTGDKTFRNVTLQLVLDFKITANYHIKELINNTLNYGSLHHLAQTQNFIHLNVNYLSFPLIEIEKREEIMKEIENIASIFYKPNTLLFNVTCLELLYFFAVLVNPNYNWITIDYISNCNKNHQYVMSAETYKNCHRKSNHLPFIQHTVI